VTDLVERVRHALAQIPHHSMCDKMGMVPFARCSCPDRDVRIAQAVARAWDVAKLALAISVRDDRAAILGLLLDEADEDFVRVLMDEPGESERRSDTAGSRARTASSDGVMPQHTGTMTTSERESLIFNLARALGKWRDSGEPADEAARLIMETMEAEIAKVRGAGLRDF